VRLIESLTVRRGGSNPDDMDDLHRLFEIHMANMMVTQMAIDEKITLAEMEALTNILMEYDDESELTIM